jgi:hypothetical protein
MIEALYGCYYERNLDMVAFCGIIFKGKSQHNNLNCIQNADVKSMKNVLPK